MHGGVSPLDEFGPAELTQFFPVVFEGVKRIAVLKAFQHDELVAKLVSKIYENGGVAGQLGYYESRSLSIFELAATTIADSSIGAAFIGFSGGAEIAELTGYSQKVALLKSSHGTAFETGENIGLALDLMGLAGAVRGTVRLGSKELIGEAAERGGDFVGPLIGKSGFRTSSEFAEAVGSRYQEFVDDAYIAGQRLEAQGLLRGHPDFRVGNYVDRISQRDLSAWLRSEGIAEGPGRLIQQNRWLRDPAGSGLYVRPDVRIPAAGRTFDATVGFKAPGSTQITRFGQYSGGDYITVVRPGPVGGSYSIVP